MTTFGIHQPISASSVSNNDDQKEGVLKIATATNDDGKRVISTSISADADTTGTSTRTDLLPVVTPTSEPRDTIQADDINVSLVAQPTLNQDKKVRSIEAVVGKASAIKPPPASLLPAPLPTASNKCGGKKLGTTISVVCKMEAPILPRGGE